MLLLNLNSHFWDPSILKVVFAVWRAKKRCFEMFSSESVFSAWYLSNEEVRGQFLCLQGCCAPGKPGKSGNVSGKAREKWGNIFYAPGWVSNERGFDFIQAQVYCSYILWNFRANFREFNLLISLVELYVVRIIRHGHPHGYPYGYLCKRSEGADIHMHILALLPFT